MYVRGYLQGSENGRVVTIGSSSASKSFEIFWAEIYWRQLFLGPNLVSFNRNRNYSAILATLQITSYALGV
jgi:hypothetical protein